MRLSIFLRDSLWRRTLRLMTLGLVRRYEIVYFFEGFFVATHPTTND
jgi:hypothetical protein